MSVPPPPPLPPPREDLPKRLFPKATTNQGTLNTDITKGIKLRKAVTRDRSAPVVPGNASGGRSSDMTLSKAPSLGAPPVPGTRARGTSGAITNETTSGGEMVPAAPQLMGLFAGGMPKLRSRGGVDTGASRPSSYIPSPEPPKPTPKPSAPPPRPFVLRPTMASTAASSPSPRRPALPSAPTQRPTSAAPLRTAPSPPLPSLSLAPSPAPPRPPVRKTPPLLPYSPPSAPPSIPRSNPPPPLPPPTSSTPSPLMSSALMAARKATGFLAPAIPAPFSIAPPGRPPPSPSGPTVRDYNHASNFTLESPGRRSASGKLVIDDSRWKFKREEDLPEPRVWVGVGKVYNSGGRGSSVPLDLKILE